MNERIQELAEQCRIEKYNQYGDLIEFGFDEEKFAELIVQEIVQGTIMRAGWYDRKIDGKIVTLTSVVDLVKLIQKEFGVEE